MYETYFGLNTKPFELVPNPLFLFNSHSHKKAISYLQYGLQERVGFILLAGEVGSGKTTIIRDLIKNLDEDIILSQVVNTSGTATEILAMINDDFGLVIEGKDKVGLLRDLNDHLVTLYSEGKRAVIIIDEAQNLSPAVLEEVRLLSNLEAENAKLVQIILVGQPELQNIITRPELRQLRQRISIHCQLEPLTRDETEDYVYHRLATAGNRTAVSWHEGTFDSLYAYSGGIPRLLNVFCDFALLCAFVEQTRELTVEMINEVIGDLSWNQQKTKIDPHHPITEKGCKKNDDGEEWIVRHLDAQEKLLQQLLDQYNQNSQCLDAGLTRIHRQLDELLVVVKRGGCLDRKNGTPRNGVNR